MLIQLREQAIIGEGFFGKVFLNDGCAIKVFKRPPAPAEEDLDPVDINDINRRKNKFNSEVEAYQKAREIDELLHFISHFRGERVISGVFDKDNKDVSDHYLLDCAYAMDYLKVKWIKYDAGNSVESAHMVKNAFRQHGINAMDDFSFYLDVSDNVVGIIDFAIEEYPLDV